MRQRRPGWYSASNGSCVKCGSKLTLSGACDCVTPAMLRAAEEGRLPICADCHAPMLTLSAHFDKKCVK
jgi:hypothetical protein